MMTDEHLRHWNILGKTDPRHTKPFQRAGGFRGTATRPIWTEYRLTEHFGPCGIGWGCDEPAFSLIPAGDELLVFCTLCAWYMEDGKRASLYGIGGDKVLAKDKNGLRTNDEAYKAAFTDALGNAFKHVGAGADIHMGLFEDDKYVREMRREFGDEPATAASQPPAQKPATNGTDHPRGNEARAAYKTIHNEVKNAKVPRTIDDIVKVHGDNIKLIRDVSPDGYEELMQYAEARKREMLAGA